MDEGTADRWTRQSEMKNHQIKQTEVDGSINITEHLHQGGVFRENFPYPLLSGSIYKGTVYMFMMNMIWVVNI